MRKKIFILSLALLFLANIANATHYLQGYSSVDDSEIRWGGSTQYETAWNYAILIWNNEDAIYIGPDNIYTYQDLTVVDVNYDDVPWFGYYDYDSVGSDEISLNEYYLEGYSSDQKKYACLHEFGHALGLDHSYPDNVLDPYIYNQTSLGSQDISDYHYLWGY
jgi:hypothetical protein